MSGNGISLSVVLPAYNEQERIMDTLRAVADFFGSGDAGLPVLHEIIAVDDASTDNTYDILSGAKKDMGRLIVLRNGRNEGKGGAIRAGVECAKGDAVFFTDVDLSTPLEEFGKLYSRYAEGYDIVIGSRAIRGSRIIRPQPLQRVLAGKLFNLLVQLLFLKGIWDSQCGFKLFRAEVGREIFRKMVVTGFAFDVEFLLLAKKAGYTVGEVPVTWINNPDTRLKFMSNLWKVSRDLARIYVKHKSGKM